MIDRGIIKWQPFDSCYSSKNIVHNIALEKIKIDMPALSEDQLERIEEKIIDAYNLNLNIKIKYYYDGIIKYEKGKINYINTQEKKIYLNNKYIYFKQILNIS